MPAFGVYPIADALSASHHEISSTYKGRHITVLDSEITGHPNPDADGFINKGLPLMVGDKIVGVSFYSAAAAADLVAVDTEGIWNLDVQAVNDAGNSAVAGGDQLYIHLTTGVISKINNTATQRPFGLALGIITGGLTERIAVKVHFDPTLDSQDIMYKTVTSGAYSYGKQWKGLLEAGESTGVAGAFIAEIDGAQTGHTYGWKAWSEYQANFVPDGSILAAGEFGFWDGLGANMAAGRMVLLQLQHIMAAAPASLHIFRVNVAQAAATVIDAVFAAANPNSIGWQGGVAGTGATGVIPIADIVGVGVVYVDCHGAVA